MSISFDLVGKSIIVTGSSSGIGRGIAIAAAEAGAFVILVARNEDRLRETAASICGEKSAVEPCDLLADMDKLPRFVMNLAKKYGQFSGLVHSAGVTVQQPLKTVRVSNLIETFSVNCVSAVMLIKGLSALGSYNENGTSAVLLSSVSGHIGVRGQLGYCASKAALELSAKTMALELIPQKIRVNTIAPATIQTPMISDIDVTTDDFCYKHPSGIGTVEDIASGAIYLLSDASRYVTGTTLSIDGGYCAQ
jgi:NAD(P)-dependent dehydrogenase (short-subunit alcohol dehydrogenase family)